MTETFSLAAALLLHEAGHLGAARLCGIPLRSCELRLTGAALTFDFSRSGYGREALVHLGGPLSGIASAASALLFFGGRAATFAGLSAVLSLVNLLPVEGLDGGGVLLCLLNRFLPPDAAWRIGKTLSALGILALWTAVLWMELRVRANLSLLLFMLGAMLHGFPMKE